MHQAGILANVTQEMDRLKLDALGISEVRWTESGSIQPESGHKLFYSGGDTPPNHGVGILLSKTWTSAVLNYLPVNDRIIMVRLLGKPFNINLIQI